MEHPIGRHRRPHQSLAGRVWALTATVLAMALAYVFAPQPTKRERAAITPPPRRRELPPTPTPAPIKHDLVQEQAGFPAEGVTRSRSKTSTPRSELDHDAGALVRPYMPPFPRVPVGDLLAAPQPHRPRNGSTTWVT